MPIGICNAECRVQEPRDPLGLLDESSSIHELVTRYQMDAQLPYGKLVHLAYYVLSFLFPYSQLIGSNSIVTDRMMEVLGYLPSVGTCAFISLALCSERRRG